MDDAPAPVGLIAAIDASGVHATFTPLREILRGGFASSADAVVLAASDDCEAIDGLLARLGPRSRSAFLVRENKTQPARVSDSKLAAVVEPNELADRLSAFLRPHFRRAPQTVDHVAARCEMELARRRLAELRRARRAQREFLPRTLPRFEGVSFSAMFRPLDCVSGDIYDVRRLDDEHVAISIVDAEGHGLPAALLTVFVRRALEGREPCDAGWRILSPTEVLRRMNEALVRASFADCQFVVAVYAVLNLRTRRIVVARGGAPYPILRHSDGACRFLRSGGGILGVSEDTTFESETIQLSPGDSLLLYSDGVESLMSDVMSEAAASVARPDEWLAATAWHAELREDGTQAALQSLGRRYDELHARRDELDDLTALSIQIDAA